MLNVLSQQQCIHAFMMEELERAKITSERVHTPHIDIPQMHIVDKLQIMNKLF